MPIYLDTRGKSSLAIGCCARCGTKVSITELRPDPNSPGLRVCGNRGCIDKFDPYRLPTRAPDKITVQYPRPDVSLVPDEE